MRRWARLGAAAAWLAATLAGCGPQGAVIGPDRDAAATAPDAGPADVAATEIEAGPTDDAATGPDAAPIDDTGAGSDAAPTDDADAGSDAAPTDDTDAGSDAAPLDDADVGSDAGSLDDADTGTDAGSDAAPTDDTDAGSDAAPLDDTGPDSAPIDDAGAGSDAAPIDDADAGSDVAPIDDAGPTGDALAETGGGDTVDPNVCPYGLSPSLFCLKWGVCSQGVALTCIGNSPVCDYAQVAGYELIEVSCDGLDNDCNGLVDDELTPPGAPSKLPGVCKGAKPVCAGALGWQAPWVALPGYQTAESACDGLDNDCDGQTDEMAPQPALLQQGVCAGLLQSCDGTAGWSEPDYSAVLGYTAGIDVGCDGVDNDCDGVADEDAACPLWQLGGSGSGRVALAPDGSQLAWLSRSGVHAVDPASGKRYYDHFGHRWQVEAAAFSPDGALLASVGRSDVLRVYPAAYGLGPPGSWPVTASLVQSGAHWTAVAFAPDGKAVVGGDDQGVIRPFDLLKGAALKPLPSHAAAVRALTFASLAQGQLAVLVSGAADGGVLARPWPGGSPWAVAKLGAAVATLDADAHGRVLIVAPGEEARLVDLASGKTAAVLQGSESAVAGRVVAASAALWTAEPSGALRRWPLPAPQPPGKPPALLLADLTLPAPGLQQGDQALDLAAGATRVVVGAPLSGPQVMHLPSLTWSRPDGTGNVAQVRLLDHPAGLLGAGADGKLRLWQPLEAKPLLAVQAHDGGLLAATWGQAGGQGWLLTGGSDFAVRLWQWPAGPQAASQAPLNIKTFGLSGPWAQDLAAVVDGASAWAAAGSSAQRVATQAAVAGQKLQVYAVGLGAHVQRVLPSGDGQRLLVALDGQGPAQGQHYRMIDAATLQPLWSRSDLAGAEHAAAWHPAGKIVALSGAGVLQLADADSGATLAPLPGWLGEARALAWNPQGTRLLAVGSDGAARVWATAPGAAPQLRAVWTRHCPPPCGDGLRSGAWLAAIPGAVATAGEDGSLMVWQAP